MKCEKIVSIFIADDNLVQQRLYSEILSVKGFEIIDTAINGSDAIQKYN